MHTRPTALFALFALVLFALQAMPTVQAQNYNVIGLVWNDGNCNGLQDVSEEGFPAVQVALMHQGTDGTIYTQDDRLLEFTTSKTAGNEFLQGDIRFTRGLPSVPANYYLAIFNADKPAGYVPGPLQAGSDRSIDNDLYLPLAASGSPLWASVPFQLVNGQVTEIDIGLCVEGTLPAIDYDNFLYVPMVVK
jgi:hypothetical protein